MKQRVLYHHFPVATTDTLVKTTSTGGSRAAVALSPRQKTVASVVGVAAFGIGFVGLIAVVLATTSAVYDGLHDSRSGMNCFGCFAATRHRLFLS